jgi:hypothetical protein
MSPESFHSLLALAIGFSVAGLICSGYQLVSDRPPSFRLLSGGPRPRAIALVPLLVFAAPFIIMRNTLRLSAMPSVRFETVMLATIVAGFWSLMSGTVVVMAVEAAGRLLT